MGKRTAADVFFSHITGTEFIFMGVQGSVVSTYVTFEDLLRAVVNIEGLRFSEVAILRWIEGERGADFLNKCGF